MQAQGTSKLLLIVLVMGLAGVVGFCVLLMGKLDSAGDKIERLEDRLSELQHENRHNKTGENDQVGAGDLQTMTDQLSDMDDTVSSLVLKLRANGKRLDRLEAGDLADLGIEELVDRKLDESIAKARYGPLGRRPDMDKLGEHLDLTARQKQQMSSLLDKAKEQVFDVMSADGGDGGDMMDSMLETMRGNGNREEKMQKILSDMFDQTVPGSDDSYFTTLMDIRTSAASNFQGVLTRDQMNSFKELKIDIFGIKTGYSPFSDELEQVLSGAP